LFIKGYVRNKRVPLQIEKFDFVMYIIYKTICSSANPEIL